MCTSHAAPVIFTYGSLRLIVRYRLLYSKAEAKNSPRHIPHWEIDDNALWQLIGSHEVERFGFNQSNALPLAAVDNHLDESGVVDQC